MNISETIRYLVENSSQSISDPDISDKISFISSHPLTPELLKKEYRPTDIQIGTVGAYLWGCSQNHYGDIPKICSPLCLNSFRDSCQYSIWVYKPSLQNIFSTSTSKAYVFVPKNWESFTNEEIALLKNHNISFVAILKTQFSIHRFVIPMTHIDDLPISKNFPIFSETVKTEKTNYYLLGFVLIFFSFFLIYRNI